MKVGDIVYRYKFNKFKVEIEKIYVTKIEKLFFCCDDKKYRISTFEFEGFELNLMTKASSRTNYSENVYSLKYIKNQIIESFVRRITELFEDGETSGKQELNILKGYFKECE